MSLNAQWTADAHPLHIAVDEHDEHADNLERGLVTRVIFPCSVEQSVRPGAILVEERHPQVVARQRDAMVMTSILAQTEHQMNPAHRVVAAFPDLPISSPT